jgi:Na+-driven multidrug efflux pump
MGVAGLVNGVLDPLLIFGPGPFPEWGIRGAAIATSLSWLMAMLVSLHLLRKRETLLTRRLSPALSCWPIGAPCSMWRCPHRLPTCSTHWPTPC